MDRSLEIRKVSIGNIYGLIQVLESSESWKKLMVNIPKDLASVNFVPKYKSHHVSIIENESKKQKRPCTEILFEEWGTSGQKRPTLANLLDILVKAELFRAAETIANLLNEPAPQRPKSGPAAKIDVSLPRLLAEKEVNKINVESVINNMSYPDLDSSYMQTYNKNIDNKTPKVLEEYNNFLQIPDLNASKKSLSTGPSLATNSTNLSSEASDMIEFSQSQDNFDCVNESASPIPQFSVLLNASQNDINNPVNSTDLNELEQESNVLKSNVYNTNSIEAINVNVSGVNIDTSEYNIPHFSVIQSNTVHDLPNISILQDGENSETFVSDFNMPVLSALQNYSSNEVPSVLPISNVSLNTTLPHYSYEDLRESTNDFIDNWHESDSLGLVGKIGSGGFGTVYLASSNLFGYPVAVKKLSFISPTGKHNEELISKQFKTEVETLSRYSHHNILSILGYSCDGPDYCLIYEYIDGGSLRENISSNKSLSPNVRMNIALNTARGIEYLHNGFSTPLIHRDIKSANILLTKSNIPKLCDFGLVKLLPDQTSTSHIIGTTAYMAPEAFRGDVSVKMDVFSFGVLLLELLTGLPPIDENRIGNDLVTHVEDMCADDSIDLLLDTSSGPWDKSDEFYTIAKQCLLDKRKRPLICDVIKKLSDLMNCY